MFLCRDTYTHTHSNIKRTNYKCCSKDKWLAGCYPMKSRRPCLIQSEFAGMDGWWGRAAAAEDGDDSFKDQIYDIATLHARRQKPFEGLLSAECVVK